MFLFRSCIAAKSEPSDGTIFNAMPAFSNEPRSSADRSKNVSIENVDGDITRYAFSSAVEADTDHRQMAAHAAAMRSILICTSILFPGASLAPPLRSGKTTQVYWIDMEMKRLVEYPVPSSFNFSGNIALRSIERDAPWPALASHLENVHPHAVLGWTPPKLQLDPRIYAIVSQHRIRYLAAAPGNLALGCELVRQMGIDFVVATAAEGRMLERALSEKGITFVRHWHIILPQNEASTALPEDAVADVHEFPGRSL
jgi:hypothetical protein